MDRLQILLYQEESFWRQRSKVTWLKEEDRNTGFFHRKAQNRKRKNMLQGLYDDEGQWFEDDAGIENVVTSYFSKMFQASEIDYEAVHTTLEAIQPSVSEEMNAQLCAPCTIEEVRRALFQMYPTKSPGPDGMPPLFFQHHWETIGTDVFEAVIANRLKVILPSVISPFQSVFVPGRLITDNILVANEIAHFVHNKREGTDGFMALKLDLSKAYDRMEWSFLRMVMVRFGFAQKWINMVMQCVSSVRYSFLIKGKPRGYVTPSRGLRQGDPLSPYLFLIGAEGFSALLQQKQALGLISGIEGPKVPPEIKTKVIAWIKRTDSIKQEKAAVQDDIIEELCNDYLGNQTSLYNDDDDNDDDDDDDDGFQYPPDMYPAKRQDYRAADVIEIYGRASGQLVNFDKSSVAFSKKVSIEMREELASYMGMQIVDVHDKYLGLPTYMGRKKSVTFQYIKDKLAKKLSDWQGKMLSGAGKDILIRVVASALPTYAMSWGSTLDKRKIHWKTWGALCNPKEGGLGFRSLSIFNMAMLAKQAWRIITNPSSLVARLYKAKYYPDNSFWEATTHASPSYSWRSIFSTRDLLREHCWWQVGDGRNIGVFSDNWVLGLTTGKPTFSVLAQSEVSRVSDLIGDTGEWNVILLQRLFPVWEVELITSMPLSRRVVADRLVWKLTMDGKYSVKAAYHFFLSSSPNYSPLAFPMGSVFWKKLWKANVPSKAKIHFWRICLDILPSLANLESQRVKLDSTVCVLCEECNESTLHLCRDCNFTQSVLQSNAVLKQVCYGPQIISSSLFLWLNSCAHELSLFNFGTLIFLLYGVWKERNERVWSQKRGEVSDVIIGSMSRLQEFQFHNSKEVGVGERRHRVVRWSAPPVGCLKINVDGSFNHVTRSSGIGFVVRDGFGVMLAGGACPVTGLLSPEHGELLACKTTIEFAMEHGYLPAILETDALNVQRQLSESTTSNTSVLGRLYDDLVLLLESPLFVKVVHIGRMDLKCIHAKIIEIGYYQNLPLITELVTLASSMAPTMDYARNMFDAMPERESSLVSMYAKNGETLNSELVFNAMVVKNIVSWTAMTAGYVKNGFYKEGLSLLQDMIASGSQPNVGYTGQHPPYLC
ncbi:uncharacterized protein LOC112163728 [Rosa chinensis]|uniref:uncharacterized protein LOC112163728 n=1 Tax=Rosa chinensis TaxID=74649 RepID=UPI000D090B9C|nr:uncharacterized protein LOC112163728 [Rosa chinensis]